jgi:hypothetical protein
MYKVKTLKNNRHMHIIVKLNFGMTDISKMVVFLIGMHNFHNWNIPFKHNIILKNLTLF